ncbi:unnamed protein product [Dicrocoelium dendriticum]|nr:unnamed protein product [Dicrocoelium dendriticum]
MDLTLNNLLLVYPVFLRWLKDTEADETREAILRSAKGEVVDETIVKQMSEKLQNCDSNLFRKHRDRTKLLPGSTKVLEKAFKTSTHPPKKVIEDLAKKLEVDKHVIRVWFYNRRQRPKSSTA